MTCEKDNCLQKPSDLCPLLGRECWDILTDGQLILNTIEALKSAVYKKFSVFDGQPSCVSVYWDCTTGEPTLTASCDAVLIGTHVGGGYVSTNQSVGCLSLQSSGDGLPQCGDFIDSSGSKVEEECSSYRVLQSSGDCALVIRHYPQVKIKESLVELRNTDSSDHSTIFWIPSDGETLTYVPFYNTSPVDDLGFANSNSGQVTDSENGMILDCDWCGTLTVGIGYNYDDFGNNQVSPPINGTQYESNIQVRWEFCDSSGNAFLSGRNAFYIKHIPYQGTMGGFPANAVQATVPACLPNGTCIRISLWSNGDPVPINGATIKLQGTKGCCNECCC